MNARLRFGWLLIFLGVAAGCARHVVMPPEKIDESNWRQWSIRETRPTLTQAEADEQSNRPAVAAPASAPALTATSPVGYPAANETTPLPHGNLPASAPPSPLMAGGWEKARLEGQVREQNLEAARQRWHFLFGLHGGVAKHMDGAEEGNMIIEGGLHLGVRKYVSPSVGIELRLTLDRGVVLVPECVKQLENCNGKENNTKTGTYLTRISGEVGMPWRVGGSFAFVPLLWLGRETYDDSEKRVGDVTHNFDYKSTLRGGPGARLAWSFADDRFDLGTTMRVALISGMYFFTCSIVDLSIVF